MGCPQKEGHFRLDSTSRGSTDRAATGSQPQQKKHQPKARPMPNQRDPDKVRLGFWITEEEKEAIKKDMKKLGIETYSDYIVYKLGIDREDGGDDK